VWAALPASWMRAVIRSGMKVSFFTALG